MGSTIAVPAAITGDAVSRLPSSNPTLYQELCRYIDRKFDSLREEVLSTFVKTVNNVGPDADGNVDVQEGLPPWIGGETIGKIDSKSTDRDIRIAVEAMRVYLKQEENQ